MYVVKKGRLVWKQKVTLVNRTSWDTRKLRKLILLCVKNVGSGKDHDVLVRYSQGCLRGLAWIGGPGITMWIPKSSFSSALFCQVLEHEIDHNLGLRHKDMINHRCIDVSYSTGISFERLEEKA